MHHTRRSLIRHKKDNPASGNPLTGITEQPQALSFFCIEVASSSTVDKGIFRPLDIPSREFPPKAINLLAASNSLSLVRSAILLSIISHIVSCPPSVPFRYSTLSLNTGEIISDEKNSISGRYLHPPEKIPYALSLFCIEDASSSTVDKGRPRILEISSKEFFPKDIIFFAVSKSLSLNLFSIISHIAFCSL